MRENDLLILIVEGRLRDLVNAMGGLSESERARSFPTAKKLHKKVANRNWQEKIADLLTDEFKWLKIHTESRWDPGDASDSNEWEVEFGTQTPYEYQVERACELSILGLGPIKDALRVETRPFQWRDTDPFLLKVFEDRRPKWADKWLEKRLQITNFGVAASWSFVRQLIGRGVCQKPKVDGYWHLMAEGIGYNHWKPHWKPTEPETTIYETVKSNPEFLEDIWHFFEIEAPEFISGHEKKLRSDGYETWTTTILKLSKDGLLDRERLLDASLKPLFLDKLNYTLAGFARMHEELDPSEKELKERQPIYQDLLAAESNSMVGFAVKMLKKLQSLEGMNEGSFLKASWVVFSVPTKGPAKNVLTLYKKIGKRNPELLPEIISLLAEHATTHASEDVVEAALSLLDQWKGQLDDSLREFVLAKMVRIPNSLQSLVRTIIGDEDNREATSSRADVMDIDESFNKNLDSLENMPCGLKKLAGIEDAISAVDSQRWPAPLEFNCFQTGVLVGMETVEPIQDSDELLDRIAHAIENVDSALEVESILDGLCRLHSDLPHNFEQRVAPILKRIPDYFHDEFAKGIVSSSQLSSELVFLILHWLTGKENSGANDRARFSNREAGTIPSFLIERIREIRHRLDGGIVAPLLAFPTHYSNWIDPNILAERWLESEKKGVNPAVFDVVQAFLRMAPDGRRNALEIAKGIQHPWAQPFRWALGEPHDPNPSKNDIDIWIAARSSRLDLPAIRTKKRAFKNLGPDAFEPSVFEWEARVKEHKYDDDEKAYHFPEINFERQPPIEKSLLVASRPTVLLHNQRRISYYHNSWETEWRTTIWPIKGEITCISGLDELLIRLDYNASTTSPNHWFLTPLFDGSCTWNDLHYLTALIGLNGRDQDVRGMAIDACIEAIQESRVHAIPLAKCLVRLNTPRWLKLNRIAENFGEIARVSNLHGATVIHAIDQLISSYDSMPKDVHRILTLLHQLLTTAEKGLSNGAREKLMPIRGSSKTAKLAAKLVSLEDGRQDWMRRARIELVESRAALCARWDQSVTP
jgi:hypothetical protein